MREIKFRVWNPEEKGLVESGATPMMLHSFFEYTARFNTQYEMPYQQFTGLLDKKGKEIYEGDVVKLKGFEPDICEVVFDRGAFCIRFAKDDQYYPDIKYVEDGEVIGDTYSTPDLIK